MGDVAIRVEGLGKQYCIGGAPARYHTLREQMMRALAAPFRNLRRGGKDNRERTFWALRDVSFEVKRGEVVGIIGRNGAGKSTLLKILSRITEPTTGEVDLYGRVGSLLEVGTGFHPELTGRENVYLNGAILGMHRAEVVQKFDEIVSFAEVEKFLDTPVKHYSSGMYTRLAFAVAAHLEPDILLVDEVLAVGDAEFQKKCLGRMGEVARQGRTVLFVSHHMHTIANLCTKSIYVDKGRVDFIGATHGAIARYYQHLENGASDRSVCVVRAGSGEARFVEARPEQSNYRPEDPKRIRFTLERVDSSVTRCSLSGHLVDENEQIVCKFDSRFIGEEIQFSRGEFLKGVLTIRQPWLKPGAYTLDLFLLDGKVGVIDRFEKACGFQVLPILPYPNSAPDGALAQAAVLADFGWELETSRS